MDMSTRLRSTLDTVSGFLRMSAFHMADAVTDTDSDSDKNPQYTNTYKTYAKATQALSDRYNGIADFGNLLIGNLVDVRAAFTTGEGIAIREKIPGTAEDELQYILEFAEFDDLDESVKTWARETEIEGQFFAVILDPDTSNPYPRVRMMPWLVFKYEVTADAGDYENATSVKYYSDGNSNASTTIGTGSNIVTVYPPNFVFQGFSNRVALPSQPQQSKLAHVLGMLDKMEQTLNDWRSIINLSASPTPFFHADTPEAAKKIKTAIDGGNWTFGKAIVSTGDFSMVSADLSGLEGARQLVETYVKEISGTCGVPVHFLGYPDLMSNRSTAENLMESVTAATVYERIIWQGIMETLFSRVLTIANETRPEDKQFNTEAITADFPQVSKQKLEQLVDVYGQLKQMGLMSKQTAIRMIPGIDPKVEMALIKEEMEAEQALLLTMEPDSQLPNGAVEGE